MVKESGQIVLITLLVLSIAMTVSLSLIGRTTTDVSMSQDVEESARAFSAAEAGIEQALKLGTDIETTQIGQQNAVTYSVDRQDVGGGSGTYVYPGTIKKGDVASIWFVAHDAAGPIDETRRYTQNTIDVCWSQANTPAIIATVFYKESSDGSYRIGKAAYDASGRGNFATSVINGQTCGVSGAQFYKTTVTFSSLSAGLDPASDTLLELRIRPVYADLQLAVVSASASFPVQGNQFVSSATTASGVSRKVVVYQQHRSVPAIFDHALYSQGDLVH